jgi:hypothetical protein
MDKEERRRRAAAQQARAMQALRAIESGADLGDETTRLSNEFTDAQTARMAGWFRRVFRRRGSDRT